MEKETRSFLEKLVDLIMRFLTGGDSKKKIEPIEITSIPVYGENSEAVLEMQNALKKAGYVTILDGHFGPKTKEIISLFQKKNGLKGSGIPGPKTIALLNLKVKKKEKPKGSSSISWFWKAKEYSGEHETNESFNKMLSGYWKYVGLPGFKSIVGSKRAWCGLFVAAALIKVGTSYHKYGATAKSWDHYGVKINWKVEGIPQGAIVRINHKGDCKSASNNHVFFSNGDCSAKDLLKAGAVISGFGGNQGNKAKISNFKASTICSVTWPEEAEPPKKITSSLNCSNGKTASKESTR